jgi:hypothetical protein
MHVVPNYLRSRGSQFKDSQGKKLDSISINKLGMVVGTCHPSYLEGTV